MSSQTDFFKKLQKKEQQALKIVKKNYDQMMEEKNFPKKFSLPLGLQFELTSQCNLKCQHCYNNSGANNLDLMQHTNWLQLSEDIIKHGGIFQLTISGGEPFIVRNILFDILDKFHLDGTIFNIITNGSLITNNIVQKLQKYNFYWVQVSIDSVNPAIHDEFRGCQGSWEKAVKAAILISNSGIPLRIATSITPKTLDEIDDICEMAFHLGASYLAIGDIIPSGRSFTNKHIFLNSEQKIKMINKLDSNIKKFKNQIRINNGGSIKTQLQYAALSPINGAIIRPDGSIRLDCSCPFTIGNVLENNFTEIWRNTSADCWSNTKIQQYIESVDYISGESTIVANYLDKDINI